MEAIKKDIIVVNLTGGLAINRPKWKFMYSNPRYWDKGFVVTIVL